MEKSSKLNSRCVMISFPRTRVTAADFDLQQSPYATPLLTPALLPIGGVRHRILNRSMRFLHTFPTGNHSRGEERIRRRSENQEILQSHHFFCWDLVRKKWERSTRRTALTWNKRCLQLLSLRHCWRDLLRMQAFPSRAFVVVKHSNKRCFSNSWSYPRFLFSHMRKKIILPIQKKPKKKTVIVYVLMTLLRGWLHPTRGVGEFCYLWTKPGFPLFPVLMLGYAN